MHPSMKKFLFTLLALVLLLSACVPGQATPDAVDIANQVNTAVAMTVAAQNAQTQAAQSLTPAVTSTTLPTQTESGPPSPTPTIPTVTAIAPPTSASGGGGGGGGGGSTTKPQYSCNPFPRKPADGTIFKPNDEFDIKWTIVNTGTKTMAAGLDVKYNLGTKLSSTTFVELPELKPGDQYVVVLDAQAPEKEGTYTMAFMVEGGLCFPYTTIEVLKP